MEKVAVCKSHAALATSRKNTVNAQDFGVSRAKFDSIVRPQRRMAHAVMGFCGFRLNRIFGR